MTDSFQRIFATSASGMSAQSIRMNTISSNLANASSVGGTEAETYHAKYPIFSEITQDIPGLDKSDQPIGGVRVTKIATSEKALDKKYDPDSPSAGEDGYVYSTNVNFIEEMTNMISASKEYEANVEVMNTTKSLMAQSINLLKY